LPALFALSLIKNAFISGAQQFCKAKNFSQTQFKNAGILLYSEAFEQVSGKFCLPKPFIPIRLKPRF